MSEIEIKKFIAGEINRGVKLSQIQDEVAEKFQVKYTFLEMRMLAAELENVEWEKLDPAPAKPKDAAKPEEAAPAAAATGSIRVTRSKIARPGALASGDVVFASGASAEWIVDQTGRPGLDKVNGEPTEQDYREMMNELQKIFAGM